MFHYLRNREIDKKKWDESVNNSVNGLIYAQSWYLDIVVPQWEALIENDYETLMPLPAKQKYGIPYLIQPRYVQQLGIFSVRTVTEEVVMSFIKRIPRKFIWSDFNLNSQNPVSHSRMCVRDNYELSLINNYHEIYNGYHENTRRNLKKALQSSLFVRAENEIHNFLSAYLLNAKIKPDELTLKQLAGIMEYAMSVCCGEIVIVNGVQGNVLAGAFFLKAMGRIIYLTSFNTEEGQKNAAMFPVIDFIVKKYAQQLLILDFEGSMIPGIARFFAGFGAAKVTYPRYIRKFF
jgi:hypothetical protein